MQPITPNYSEMGSSTGFKKRSLIRPPSSSGIKERDFLRSIDLSQPESAISSLLKNELSTIQEYVNQLDLDKKIRLGESTLEKGYVLNLRKWLRDVQTMGDRYEDEIRILKYMNVPDLSTGFKKLWRIVCLLDALVVKSTELQLVSFLKYDDLFSSLCKDYSPSLKKVSAVSQNFTAGSFLASQLLVYRQQDLFSIVSKLRKGAPQSSTNLDAEGLLSQLQAENAKLSGMLEKMSQYMNSKPKEYPKPAPKYQPKESVVVNISGIKVYKAVIDSISQDISQRYESRINYLTRQLYVFMNEYARLKQELKISTERQEMLQKDLKEATMKPSRSGNSFEAALQYYLANMKAGFEAKITRLINDHSTRYRYLKKKENEFRIEAEKVRFYRSLLLKKYDLMK